jgi:hypothetical protein
VEVDGDEVELEFEFELKWSTARTAVAGAHLDGVAEA